MGSDAITAVHPDVTDFGPLIDDVFAHFHDMMLAKGFRRVEEVRAGSFGNRYSSYTRDKTGARLLWGGRDEWFVLEGGSPWDDLLIHRSSEGKSGNTIAAKLNAALDTVSPDASGARPANG